MNFKQVCLKKNFFFVFCFNFLCEIDSQYRQMANTEIGSIAGFLYLPNFHTLFNVFKDLFNICYHVCIIFCGKIYLNFFWIKIFFF